MSDNVPVSIWRDTDGLTEYSNTGVEDIVDTSDVNLVDTDGVDVVDTGVTATLIPSTTWTEDDSQ